MMTKTCLLAVGCACALAASGMPSQAELQKAQSIVNEVMRSDVAAFNAGKKKAAEVADAALKYAGEAQGESARFLLLKGAFFYRMRAGDYDGAMAVIAQMRREIADVPDKTIASILSSALRRVPRTHCGQLYELLEHTQNRIRYTQEIKEFAAKAKAKPFDKAVRTALGEKYALLGDWKAALHEFASGTGPAAEAAALERKASAKPGDVADIWWSLAGTDGSDLSLAYRAHAARFYRAALHGGSLAGLKKTLAEKRIAQAKADGLFDEPEDAVSTAQGSGAPAVSPATVASGTLYCVIDLSAGPKARKYPVSYLNAEPRGGWTDEYKTTKLVLRRIEPGSFKLRGRYDVILTKPFYIGVFEVTQKQYELVAGGNQSEFKGDMRPVEKVSWNAIRGDSAIHNWPIVKTVAPDSFVGLLGARTGLTFDLPTDAQWEYASRAGTTSDYNNGGKTIDDLNKLGRVVYNQKRRGLKESDADAARHVPDGKGGYFEAHTTVGSYLPNAWGLYDMHGNVYEWCLDWPGPLSNGTDPVGPLFSGRERRMRGGSWFRGARHSSNSVGLSNERPSHPTSEIGFRLVAAPDFQK